MALRTLHPRSSLLTLLPNLGYTLSRLRAHPFGGPHVATFEALRAEGLQVLGKELALAEAVADAQARVDAAGETLDHVADQVSRALLNITDSDRDNPLYVYFFNKKNLTEFKRPVLGTQLSACRSWVAVLGKSPHAELQALHPVVETSVLEAEAAEAARGTARQQNRQFRELGERRKWVDRLNAARKQLHGVLAGLPHQHPGLPSSFADQFFIKESRHESSDAEEPEETSASLRAQAEAVREALARIEARIVEVEAAEAAAKRRAEARAANAALLAEMDRAAAELEHKRALLRARLSADAED